MNPSDRRPPGAPVLPPELFRTALEHVHQAVTITDSHGRVVYWNSAAEQLFGHPAEAVIGRDIATLVVPPDTRAFASQLLRRLPAGGTYVGEFEVRDRDGRTFPIQASLAYQVGPDRRPYVLAASLDLTESRELAKERTMLTSIVTSSPAGVVATDLGGVVLWVNRSLERLLGWPLGDLAGRPLDVLFPQDRRGQLAQARDRCLAGAEEAPTRTTALHRDGTEVHVALTLTAYHDAHGQVAGTTAAIWDVSEEVARSHELAATLQRLRARFDQVSLPQAVLDLSGRVTAVNDAGCRLLGRSREELTGVSIFDLVHPMDPGAWRKEVLRLRRGEARSVTYETIGLQPNGDPLPMLIDLTVVESPGGGQEEVALFARDLREVKEARRRLVAQESLFRALNRRSSDLALVTDAEANLVYVSPSVSEGFGYSPEELVADWAFDFVHPDDLPRAEAGLQAVLARPDATERVRLRIRHADGRWRWVEETITNCLTDPDIGGVVANLRDITAEVEALEALRESEARYRAIAETAQEGIVALAPDGRTLFANGKLAEIMGRELPDIYARGVLADLPGDEAGFLERRLRSREERGAERYEVEYAHPDGGRRILSISASPLVTDAGETLGSLAMVADVTSERQAEAELQRQALHDALTGLPNRALLNDRLAMAAARLARGDSCGTAVLFLDLDHLKMVNDSRGHDVGDQLIVAVGHRLQGLVRESDTVARIGGDEFAIVCESTDLDGARLVAERISDAFAAPVTLAGAPVYVSASVGIAQAPPHEHADLLRFADAAMYKAKAEGRGRYVVFDRDLARGARRRLDVATAVRQALAGEEIELHFQPILSLEDRRVLGLEALLRWTHPQLGALPPGEVVASVEESGRHAQLDALVLRTACRQMVGLLRSGAVPAGAYVSVNTSARTVGNVDFEAMVLAALEESGLDAAHLQVEVTESAIMQNAARAVETLQRLNRRGVCVAVDDFGTGYSSLAYLHRLPLDLLKIDRSFVQATTGDSESSKIVRSVVGLAEALGLRTVAEGIETEEQATTMRHLGCHAGQGFLWSPAVPARQLVDVLRELKSRSTTP